MEVKKRNGSYEEVNFQKILNSVQRVCQGLGNADYYKIATKTVGGLYDGVSTKELDELSIQTSIGFVTEDPIYSKVASRLLCNLIDKEVSGQEIHSFSLSIQAGYINGLISKETYDFAMANKRKLNSSIKLDNNKLFDYFGLKNLQDRYLIKHPITRLIIETPQYFLMRVACGLSNEIKEVIEFYNLLSSLEYMTSTPTLFNSGTLHPQMSSCLTHDTKIFEKTKGFIDIIDILVGDIVETHTGSFKEVIQLHKNKLNNRTIYQLNVNGINNPILITDNHRVLVLNSSKLSSYWLPISYLTEDDYIMVQKSIVNNINDYEHYYLNNMLYMKISSIVKTDRNDEYVYTLGVEEDHSYSANGIIVENCYILPSPIDSLEGIEKLHKDTSMLSKWAGGIGFNYSSIRSSGSLIKGTNGKSNGIVPFLHSLSANTAAINQGGKRKGSSCVYLEPWHPDIMEFLELRDQSGEKEERAYNLNLANWIPDLFMKRVENDEIWSLIDPNIAPELTNLHGIEFENYYLELENEQKYTKQIKARTIWTRMLKTLSETGNGWICFKDTANKRCNNAIYTEKNIISIEDEYGNVINYNSNDLVNTSRGLIKANELTIEDEIL